MDETDPLVQQRLQTALDSTGGTVTTISDFKSFVDVLVNNIMTPLVRLIFAAAVVYFLYGVLKYVHKGGSEDDRRAGRGMMVWGVVAIAVMFSIWGLVNLVLGTFEFKSGRPTIPTTAATPP